MNFVNIRHIYKFYANPNSDFSGGEVEESNPDLPQSYSHLVSRMTRAGTLSLSLYNGHWV